MKRLFAEGLGTFLLVFCGAGAATIDEVTNGGVTHVGVAITFGLIVTTIILLFGKISGAHVNPAVSIALFVNKQLNGKRLIGYVAAQVGGGVFAGFVLYVMFPESVHLGSTFPANGVMQSFVLEVILTFLLMLTILRITSQNSLHELPIIAATIGGVVLLEAMFAGPICGASMNPARSIGPAVFTMHTDVLWLYILAPIVGALLAVLTNIIFKHD
jgi:aquaporin NIP